jgi:hypothetical protein
VQYRPTAEELLDSVAQLLEDEVMSSVSGPLQHKVRVAAHLTRMVRRELETGADADADEQARLAAILGVDGSLTELRARLAARLADPAPIDAVTAHAVHGALVATARADLAICKPGYDRWTAES